MVEIEKWLSSLIVSFLAITTSLAFIILPSILLYTVIYKINEKGEELMLYGIILITIAVLYNIVVFLSTPKPSIVRNTLLERFRRTCFSLGNTLFVLAAALIIFILLTSLLENYSPWS